MYDCIEAANFTILIKVIRLHVQSDSSVQVNRSLNSGSTAKQPTYTSYQTLPMQATSISVQPNIRRIHPIVLTRPVVSVVPPEALVLFAPELVRAALYPVIVQDYTPPLLTELFSVLLLPDEASRTIGKHFSIQEDHPKTVLELAFVAPDLPTTLRLAQHVLKAWLQQEGKNGKV